MVFPTCFTAILIETLNAPAPPRKIDFLSFVYMFVPNPLQIYSSPYNMLFYIAFFLLLSVALIALMLSKKVDVQHQQDVHVDDEEVQRKKRAMAYAKKLGIFQDDLRNIHLR